MTNISISQRLRTLSTGDRMLLKSLVSSGLLTLALGVVFGLITPSSAQATWARSRKPVTA